LITSAVEIFRQVLGEVIVKHYRVYKLAEPKGRIVKAKDVHAAHDDEALQRAEQDEDCPVCEVWQGAKKVGYLE
jgi:hypothetical protein